MVSKLSNIVAVKNPDNVHQLIPDKEAAEVVRLVFTMAAEGKKKPEIVRFLNERGTPTCMEHFQALGLKRKSYKEKEKKLWTVTTIGDMLKKEVYLGKAVWRKTRQAEVGSKRQVKNDRSEWIIIEGTHEPLVTQELFDTANAKAFTHEKKIVPAGRKPQPILFCPHCGRRFTLTSWGNAYRCGEAATSGIAECRTIHVDRERLENAVLSCTRTMAGMVSAEVSRKKKEWEKTAAVEEEIRKLEAEGKRLSSRKLRLYEDYRSGKFTKEQYRREYESTASRILEIEKRIPELKDKTKAEVGGLKWEDVDFKNKCININRSLSCQYESGVKTVRLTAPKTHNSYRKIPFMGEAEEMFLSQKKKQEKIKKELGKRYRSDGEFSDLVFVTSMGSPVFRHHAEKEVKTTDLEIFDLVYEMNKEFLWLGHCFNHFEVTNVGANHDLMQLFDEPFQEPEKV